MANSPFAITITAVDKTTATMRRINAQMAKLTSPVRDLRKSIGDFSKEAGFTRVADSFGKVATSAKDCVSSISSMIPAMAFITSTATIGGVIALAAGWGKLAQQVANTSDSLGVSTQSLQAYQNAARLAGSSAEDMTATLKSLGDAIEDATSGRNAQAQYFMARFGMTLTRTKSGAVDATRALKQVAEAVAGQKGNVQAQRLILRTFGISESLLPMLQKGAKGVDDFVAAGAKMGNIYTPEQIEQGKQYAQNVTLLDGALEGLKNTIGNALIPVLQPMLESLSKWVTQNKDLIASDVSGFVKDIAAWIKSVDWSGVAKTIGEVVTALGGLKGVAIGLAAISFAGPISGVLTLAGALVKLTTAVIPAATTALGGIGGAAAGAGVMGLAATAGIAGGLAYAGVKAAEATGVAPETDRAKGIDAVAHGQWFQASRLLPAADFARAVWMRGQGQSNAQIAAMLKGNAPAGTVTGGPVTPAPGAAPGYTSPALPAPATRAAPAAEPPIYTSPALPASAAPAAAAAPVRAGKGTSESQALFARLETQYGLPSGLLDSVWATESGRGQNMMSAAGAMGHFQFMPGTAKQYGVANPYDLTQSATGAAKMYADLLRQTGGNLPAALAGYNWGMGNVEKKGLDAMPAETRNYIQKVTARMGAGAGAGDEGAGAGTMQPVDITRRIAGAGGAVANAGKVLVEVVLANFPAGTKATTQASGNVTATTRVREPLLTSGAV
jgi:soluble lytic murein transglycosylase-like protein